MNFSSLKIAVVHDWLVTSGGAERVLEQILSCFPQADLYVVLDFLPSEHKQFLKGRAIKTSFIQHLPLAKRMYWYYLPLMPLAVEQLDLSDYDIIISSSHVVAKGVITGPDQLHISYVHSPIRFAWDLQKYYLATFGYERGIKSLLARLLFHYVRIWDSRTANGIDAFIANSYFIARRILKTYRREATVIYPPINTDTFSIRTDKQDFYLTASFMNPFKKIDLVVEAFANIPSKQLIVIGDGPDFRKIQSKAGANVQFLGYRPNEELRDYMQRAKAFIFAAPEDFGIIMAEAQACGTPVIAYGKGGAVEIIRGLEHENPTGVLFAQQTVACLVEAIAQFEMNLHRISSHDCRENALRFSPTQFQEALKLLVEENWSEFKTQQLGLGVAKYNRVSSNSLEKINITKDINNPSEF